jgi:hypothetical protein
VPGGRHLYAHPAVIPKISPRHSRLDHAFRWLLTKGSDLPIGVVKSPKIVEYVKHFSHSKSEPHARRGSSRSYQPTYWVSQDGKRSAHLSKHKHPRSEGACAFHYMPGALVCQAQAVLVCARVPSFSSVNPKGGFCMSETGSDHPVNVTAQERAHPAIRKLARACIALVRQRLEAAGASPPVPKATPELPVKERRHD